MPLSLPVWQQQIYSVRGCKIISYLSSRAWEREMRRVHLWDTDQVHLVALHKLTDQQIFMFNFLLRALWWALGWGGTRVNLHRTIRDSMDGWNFLLKVMWPHLQGFLSQVQHFRPFPMRILYFDVNTLSFPPVIQLGEPDCTFTGFMAYWACFGSAMTLLHSLI